MGARRDYWHITISPNYKPGDPEPSGYLDWHEWASVQHKAGLRQIQCQHCCRWKYPQSLSVQEVARIDYAREAGKPHS